MLVHNGWHETTFLAMKGISKVGKLTISTFLLVLILAARRKKVIIREKNRICRVMLMARVAMKKINVTMPAVQTCFMRRKQIA